MWRPSKSPGKKPNYAELWNSVKRWRVIQKWCTEKLHYVYPLWQHNDNQQFIHYAITSFANAICRMSALITIYFVLHDMGLLPRQLKMKFCFKLLLLFSFWIKLSQNIMRSDRKFYFSSSCEHGKQFIDDLFLHVSVWFRSLVLSVYPVYSYNSWYVWHFHRHCRSPSNLVQKPGIYNTLSDVATPDNKGYKRKTWSDGWKCTLSYRVTPYNFDLAKQTFGGEKKYQQAAILNLNSFINQWCMVLLAYRTACITSLVRALIDG